MAKVVFAPSRPSITGRKIIFLAGTTTRVDDARDWRKDLTRCLATISVTIMNPMRLDWDDSWPEDVSFTPFCDQVRWELDMQELADLVVVYFGPATDALISLLEFGLRARKPGKALVMCHGWYRRKGNVQMVCDMFGILCFEETEMENLASEIRRRLDFGQDY